MKKTFRFLLCVLFSLSFVSCASSYHSRIRSAHQSYYKGDYAQALIQMDKVKPSPRDELIYLLDKGMILHAAGHYKESNLALTKAEDLSDAFSSKSLSRESAATFWSEEAREYPGDNYERLMIPVIRMMNYLRLKDWPGTLVEARRTLYLIDKVYGGMDSYDNGFAIYLSAIVWEAMGHANDALIDYKQLNKKGKSLPYYAHDIQAISKRLGMQPQLPKPNSLAWEASPNYRQELGELIVIAQIGQAPVFVSEKMSTGYFSVSIPSLKFFPPLTQFAKVSVDQKEIGRTYAFWDVLDDTLKSLKVRRKRTFKRKLAKTAVQTGLFVAGSKMMKDDSTAVQLAGLGLGILGLSMAAADKADERSWRTLPAQLHIGRFYLPLGSHHIEVSPVGGPHPPLIETVEITKAKPALIVANFMSSEAKARIIKAPVSARIQKLRDKEKRLTLQVSKEPKDGHAKIELARTRMELGNFDVEGLLTKGIGQATSKREGRRLMLITKGVKEQFKMARMYAKMNDDKIYESEMNYLLAKKRDAKPPKITFNRTVELTNGFHHFLLGLNHEKTKDYEAAVKKFADAYEYGLIGKPVADKIVSTLEKTDKKFKKSPAGLRIYDKFTDVYLDTN